MTDPTHAGGRAPLPASAPSASLTRRAVLSAVPTILAAPALGALPALFAPSPAPAAAAIDAPATAEAELLAVFQRLDLASRRRLVVALHLLAEGRLGPDSTMDALRAAVETELAARGLA